jgi:hypothetical protein
MENENNKQTSGNSTDTANIRQADKEQRDDRGEINLGGREFTGNQMDNDTDAGGLPTVDPDEVNQTNKNSQKSRKS